MDAIKAFAGLKPEPSEEDLMARIAALKDLASSVVKDIGGSLMTDPRWTSIAKTDLQRGIMALERAVTKPDTF
jgi:hypothetical protein